jgi:hypothetical protein
MNYDSIVNMSDLDEAITLAVQKRNNDYREMKSHVTLVLEGFRASNLLKDAVMDMKGDKEISGGILNSASAMAAGYASKRIFEAGSTNKIRKLLGTAIMFGVSKWINGNPQMLEGVREQIGSILVQFSGKRKTTDSSDTES